MKNLFYRVYGRWLFLGLLLTGACWPGRSFGQVGETRLTVSFKQATLVEVFDYIGQHSDLTFVYNVAAVKADPVRVTHSFKDSPVEEMLKISLVNSNFTYERVGTSVVLRPKVKAVEERVVRGKVVNERNEPLPGVTIRLEGSSLGVASDVEGNFVLRLPVVKGVLLFTFVGYKDKKVNFTDQQTLSVKMAEEVAALDEVQVVAYGQQKKRTLVSAISSVKADDIKELPTHSLESLLQGHMAGVEVNNISGSPGGGGSIVAIRGYNSLFVDNMDTGGNEGEDRKYGTPLYVIDGVPVQAFTSPVTGTNTLSDLDPSMIESIEVLKDAASAAIYGSRAGNGVVLITTKKGRAGQAKFTANISYSASWLPATPKQTGGRAERYYQLNALLNTIVPYQTADGEWKMPASYEEVYQNGTGLYPPQYDWFWGNGSHAQNEYALQDSLNAFFNNSTDWWRYAYRTANVYNANLQASGGGEKFKYMVGAGYYKEEGIMINSNYQRANVITNLTAQPSRRLRLDNQISLTYTDRSHGGNSSGSGAKVEGVTVDPTLQSSLYPGSSYIKEEMLEQLNSEEEKNHGYGARYNLVLDYEIIRNLHLRLSGGLDFNQQNQNNFKPSTLDRYRHWSVSAGTIARNLSLLNENLLSYQFTIRKDHNFDVLLGLSFQKDQAYVNEGNGTGGPNDHIHYVQGQWGNAEGLLSTGEDTYRSAFRYASDFEEERMNSYFGRLSYNFREKYMFEATIRRDGSSVFGSDVRWATFPSVALGWAFTEETFLKRFYWLSFGKIRASWGKSGRKFNQRYLAKGLMDNSFDTFHGQAGMEPSTAGGVINRSLRWEETNQYDLGLDMSFLDYRLKFTLDYYYRYTKGQLQQISLPGDVYYHSFQWQNALAVSNQGLELELTADIFRETAVTWRLKFNASRNWNRFEKSSDGYDFGGAVLGKPINQIKAYKTQGYYNSLTEVPVYYQANGSPMPLWNTNVGGVFFGGMRRIVDLNGDGVITNAGDTYYAASPLPLAYGGFTNEIRWKQFDLNIFFNYSIGRHILKQYDDLSLSPKSGPGPIMADLSEVTFWEGPHTPNADYPHLQLYEKNESQFLGKYDCDIEKVNMIRLKQLTLGYNLHDQAVKRLGITGARIFLTMENLFMLTNYSGLDPEIVDITSGLDNLSSYPLPRKFSVGLTLNF